MAKLINKNEELIAKQLLKDIGFKVNYLGYKYWFDAIIISRDIQANNRQPVLMNQLYYLIARKYEIEVSKVKEAMRYCCRTNNLQEYFKTSYKITNTVLLSLLLEKMEFLIESNYIPDPMNFPKIIYCEKEG